MPLARVVSFDGVSSDRIAEMQQEMESSPPPDNVPAKEIVVLHDPEAEKSLVIVFFDTEDDYRQGDEALSAMPAGRHPGPAHVGHEVPGCVSRDGLTRLLRRRPRLFPCPARRVCAALGPARAEKDVIPPSRNVAAAGVRGQKLLAAWFLTSRLRTGLDIRKQPARLGERTAGRFLRCGPCWRRRYGVTAPKDRGGLRGSSTTQPRSSQQVPRNARRRDVSQVCETHGAGSLRGVPQPARDPALARLGA